MMTAEQKQFVEFIQAVGRGQRSGRCLTQAEACTAMGLLLNDKVSAEQKGAFLMLLRVREETADEIAGFTEACRHTLPSALSSINVDLDIGAYAGKRRQLPWFLLAVACLVENGVTVGMHGTQEPESKRLYIEAVINAILGKEANKVMAMTLEDIPSRLQSKGFVYANLSILHPQLYSLIQLREQFGLRSCANTLARLLNPFAAKFSLQGVHHRHVDEKHMDVAQRLMDKNTLCFRGEGGEPELDPSKDTQLLFCRDGERQNVAFVAKQQWEIKPKALEPAELKMGWKGETLHSYGENTVLASLSALLMLLDNSEYSQASKQAKHMWDTRNTKRFLGCEV